MAQEFVTLEPKIEFGTVKLNKTIFTNIALNVIEEEENVTLVEGSRPFKNGIQTTINDNEFKMVIPIKVHYKANVSDVCANLQTKIFESISYTTDFKPEAIEIKVVGFTF